MCVFTKKDDIVIQLQLKDKISHSIPVLSFIPL